jgi:hypothetical protein
LVRPGGLSYSASSDSTEPVVPKGILKRRGSVGNKQGAEGGKGKLTLNIEDLSGRTDLSARLLNDDDEDANNDGDSASPQARNARPVVDDFTASDITSPVGPSKTAFLESVSRVPSERRGDPLWAQKQVPQAPLSRRLSASNEPSPPSQPSIGNNSFQQPAPSFTARPVQQVQQPQRLPLSQSQPLPQKQQQPLSHSQPLPQKEQQQQQQEEKSTSLITAFSVKGSAPALGNGMALQYQKYDRAAGTTPVTASTSTTGASPSYALDNMSKRLHSSSSSSSSSTNNSNVNISSSTANGNNDNSNNNTTSNDNLSINTSADPPSRSREPSQSSLPNYMGPTKSSHRVRGKGTETALSHTPSRPTTAPVASSNFSSSFGSSVSRAGGERVSSAGPRGSDRVMIGLGSRLDTSMRLNTTPGLFGGPAPYAAYDNEPKKQRGQKKRLKKLKGSAGTFQQQQQMQQQQQQSSGRLNNRMGSSFGLGIGGVGLL